MFQLILGNIIALIGSILMVISGTLKDRKKILYVQTIQILLLTISDLILGGYTGAIINFISLIRNILGYKDKLNIPAKIILIISSVSLSICFNNLGFIGILPIISTITYTLFMDVKDTIKLKILIGYTMILWLVYDITIKSYTSAVFDLFTSIACVITIYQLLKTNKSTKDKNKTIKH